MALALSPADFAGGAEAADGSEWVIGEGDGADYYKTNPRLWVAPGYRTMVRLWSLMRGGGMSAAGYLPSEIGRQYALNLSAIEYIGQCVQEQRPKRGEH